MKIILSMYYLILKRIDFFNFLALAFSIAILGLVISCNNSNSKFNEFQNDVEILFKEDLSFSLTNKNAVFVYLPLDSCLEGTKRILMDDIPGSRNINLIIASNTLKEADFFLEGIENKFNVIYDVGFRGYKKQVFKGSNPMVFEFNNGKISLMFDFNSSKNKELLKRKLLESI